jgi:hypothetical protein
MIYTDASHRGDIIVLGIYNNDTGVAIAKVIPISLETNNNTDYGELRAVYEASVMYPQSKILTDSRTTVEYCRRRKPCPDVMSAWLPDTTDVHWIQRKYNVVADWLSRSPIDLCIKLAPGLNQIHGHRQINGSGNSGRGKIANERVKAYDEFLSTATYDSISSAPDWMRGWLLTDALQYRGIE